MIANLIANAIDALPEGGNLTISAFPAARNGSHGLEVRIEDDGIGIPAENLNRIFEPFFTTKADVGTGLGLWVTKQIAERHGGTVEVVSRLAGPKKGTVFSIYLPDHGTISIAAETTPDT
jgi:signal transduction histidine kinase